MSTLSHLSPAPIWIYFEEICRIPRLSKNEGKIRKYLLDFAARHKLESKEDTIGNILITRPPSPGYELRKSTVLQSHMDMVGEKNADYPHNWLTDPIIPYIIDGHVAARGTTLGADDGIGIASQLAILTDLTIKTGKIECLFTVDEESGMTGAIALKPGFFEGKTLINLDSEDEGILYIGCAGGIDTVGNFYYKSIPAGDGSMGIKISLTGLRGGHSGDEIHKGYGNSVKIMNSILSSLADKFGISVNSFNGGNLRNAIPREAFAVIAADRAHVKEIVKWIEDRGLRLAEEFAETEKDIKLAINEIPAPLTVMDRKSQDKLIRALDCCPHGVIAWSEDIEDLVETSTNLASVSFDANNRIRIVTTQRSSVESSKHEVAGMVEKCLKMADAMVLHSDGYPGWKPDLRSEILRITTESYEKLFGRKPLVRAIHAGLECGLIYEKFHGIDMISIGPTIRGAHTPEEKIRIDTVEMFWSLLTDVIDRIPDVTRGE
ncbi:MAG: aminoacyl-histidine dipeptidase [Bacteroidales bacterium]